MENNYKLSSEHVLIKLVLAFHDLACWYLIGLNMLCESKCIFHINTKDATHVSVRLQKALKHNQAGT